MREEGKMWEKGVEKRDVFFVGGTLCMKGKRKLSTKAAYSSLLSAHGAQSFSPTAVEVIVYYHNA